MKFINIGVILFFVVFLSNSDARPVSPFSVLDSSPLSKRSLINVSVVIEPALAPQGSTFELHVQIVITPGYHIYSLEEMVEGEWGTKIQIIEPVLEPSSEWKESPYQVVYDGALKKAVKVHENLVEFVRKFFVPRSASNGEILVVGRLKYRLCDNRICSLPEIVKFQTALHIE